jgi:ATP-dependent Lon protease
MKSVKIRKVAEERELKKFPLLPLRDIVVFPGMVVPLFIGRDNSVIALESAMESGRMIFLSAQKNSKTEQPSPEDIYSVGTLCQIIQLLRLPNGNIKVLVEGKFRGEIQAFELIGEHYAVEVILHAEQVNEPDIEVSALMKEAASCFEGYISQTKSSGSFDTELNVKNITSPDSLVDTIAPQLNLKLEQKQNILSIFGASARLEALLSLISSETDILQLDLKIKERVKKKMEENHREYYLNEQLKIIQNELGKKDEHAEEHSEMEIKIREKRMPEEARKKALGEFKKLRLMSPLSAEAALIRNYLDTILDLPWDIVSKVDTDIHRAAKVMDQDHYGLEKVKLRILEHLAVQSLAKRIKGPILCLVGPPGVGKTSMARSIARATSRKFVKMSLGGLRDEAEIRGHRRTYIGAMPGKILHNIKKAGVSNPLYLLDEIDKLSSDFRGDPASALLEVLDPEQNSSFCDHFLDIDYDLSRVMFVATANTLHSIPRPLLDRMEIIRIEGYTDSEKLNIAKQYLVPKQLKESGLTQKMLTISDTALLQIITCYTREPGVRGLEKQIATLCRKIAHNKVKGDKWKRLVEPEALSIYLGPERFKKEAVLAGAVSGVVNGLAWTESGGDILQVEVSVVTGKGKLIITGKLGEVMNESAQAAMTYVRSRADVLGLDKDFYQSVDIHIHVPEGAIPKDGPSAGITMATALVSALTGKPVRRTVAMTGEISLQGRVLPIGGLKEKLMAAVRAEVTTVLIPEMNQADIQEISAEIVDRLEIVSVCHMDDVLSRALDIPHPGHQQPLPEVDRISTVAVVTH